MYERPISEWPKPTEEVPRPKETLTGTCLRQSRWARVTEGDKKKQDKQAKRAYHPAVQNPEGGYFTYAYNHCALFRYQKERGAGDSIVTGLSVDDDRTHTMLETLVYPAEYTQLKLPEGRQSVYPNELPGYAEYPPAPQTTFRKVQECWQKQHPHCIYCADRRTQIREGKGDKPGASMKAILGLPMPVDMTGLDDGDGE